MKPKVYRKPKVGSHSYLGKNFSGKGGRFGSKLYKGIKRREGESLENAFLKLEQEPIKDCVDITTEYLRYTAVKECTEILIICDVCLMPLFAPKTTPRLVLTDKGYIAWHRNCMRAEMGRIWKEIFISQELKRKK